MDNSPGLDYGSGLAYSYFHGYLNILLPECGDERKGLKELIEQFESQHCVNVPVKKMFLLIPFSGFCPPKIQAQSKMDIDNTGVRYIMR